MPRDMEARRRAGAAEPGPRDLLLAVTVVAVWGTNFVVIRAGLDHMPPLLFASLRFLFALFPAVFFLERPPVPWPNIAAYGLLGGAGQFGLLFVAMNGRISPGLASLVIQMQVFFTTCLAVPVSGERIRLFQTVALLVATAGILIIAAHTDLTTTPGGLALVLGAALCWAGANLLVKSSRAPNMLAYVVWGSLFAFPPLLALALAAEGGRAILQGLTQATWQAWASVLWQSAGNTLFGFAAWGWLLARYPAATITPMALLVPVFGIGASVIILGESLPAWKLTAAGLIVAGLAINLFFPRLLTRFGGDRRPAERPVPTPVEKGSGQG